MDAAFALMFNEGSFFLTQQSSSHSAQIAYFPADMVPDWMIRLPSYGVCSIFIDDIWN